MINLCWITIAPDIFYSVLLLAPNLSNGVTSPHFHQGYLFIYFIEFFNAFNSKKVYMYTALTCSLASCRRRTLLLFSHSYHIPTRKRLHD